MAKTVPMNPSEAYLDFTVPQGYNPTTTRMMKVTLPVHLPVAKDLPVSVKFLDKM